MEGAGFGHLAAEFFVFDLQLLVFDLELCEFVAFLGGGTRHGDEDGTEHNDHSAKREDEHRNGFIERA